MGDDPAPPSLLDFFAGLCGPWDTACFIVNNEAKLIAANQAGVRLLGAGATDWPGKTLTDFLTNPPESVHRYLSVCARNRQQVPGVLTCAGNDGVDIRYRCVGHRIDTRASSAPLVFLRCNPSHNLADKFIALNEQLDKQHRIQNQLLVERDQLQVEIAERQRVEEELRQTTKTLNLIVENLPDMVFLKDGREFHFLQFNHAGETMLGIPREELLGKNDHDFFTQEQANFFTGKDREVFLRGEVVDIPEEPIRARDGQTRFLHTKKVPILDERGEPAYLLGISEDITNRKKAEEALRASEEKYRTVADFTYDWEYWVSPERQFIYCSPACERITGYSASEFIDNPSLLETIAHPEDQEEFRRHLSSAPSPSGAEYESEFRILHRSGEIRWISHACRAVYDRNGTYQGRRGANRDITDRKHAEEARISLEKQLLHAQKLESLGVLAGGIAHDFNNILMAIIGNADLALVKVPPEAPVVEYLRNIETAATRAADLAKQMLAYSGKGKFFVEPLEVNRLLREMLHMLEVSISKKAVLRLNLGEIPTVEADATQLRQVVMNLVINASEAIGDRSGVISITTGAIECDARYLQDIWQGEGISPGSYLYLEVADTGCGMDKETVSRIFDPFFTTKFTGRGLGLSAVIGIVRGHRGGIKVYSEPGKGTSFKILLPSSHAPAAPDAPREQGDQWQGEGTVLLVDDEEAVRGIGSQMLRELGFTPVTAKDGREALAIYREHPGIEFVILDLTMPHLDGEQCFRELRQTDPQAKVIISSGYNEQEIFAKFAGKGLSGFIQKPYHLNSLREAIKKLHKE
ncbi:PAS domain-containing hybrid sensor histidine kinase/response regulator [Geomesophilobacter sediminis]|uniref:histidine kinase n=1 Tax=Geomesophilobacter sediminis TaxID=2798584 RepID=A0A8J7JDH8_9BACT|nr:PAS domain S-box protein [Geomesophilobacter sediminis]MBJ6725183.1 PAS domain S-box protein [Geomesophilobacter sediminis]